MLPVLLLDTVFVWQFWDTVQKYNERRTSVQVDTLKVWDTDQMYNESRLSVQVDNFQFRLHNRSTMRVGLLFNEIIFTFLK